MGRGRSRAGQAHRKFLEVVAAQGGRVILLDEPFTGVDKKTEGIILEIFSALKAQGKTLLVCSHEWGSTLKRYDRLLLLNQRLLANDTPQAVMTFENIQRAYGQNLQPSLNGHADAPLFC